MPEIPEDDLNRDLVARNVEEALHLGVAGDTYTILLSGEDTAGHYCLVDMHVPPGGGPPLHRHDFEETFTLLEGELKFTFRGNIRSARSGETIHIPANSPHRFENVGKTAARMLCICSPAGQERFFSEIGVKMEGRTDPPPKLEGANLEAVLKKVVELAPRYRTQML